MSSKQINQLPSGIANSEAVVAADNADLTATEKIKLGDIAKLATSSDITYDNTTSGLVATNVKAALDEVAEGPVAYDRLPVGSTGSTVCAGDDVRLSDPRIPVSHTHVMANLSDVTIASSGSPAVPYEVVLTYNYSTSSWVAKAAGNVGVGSQPLGGWPAGSFGSALSGKVSLVNVPTSATAAGVAGQIAYDADHIYICTAANTWKRTAIDSWNSPTITGFVADSSFGVAEGTYCPAGTYGNSPYYAGKNSDGSSNGWLMYFNADLYGWVLSQTDTPGVDSGTGYSTNGDPDAPALTGWFGETAVDLTLTTGTVCF